MSGLMDFGHFFSNKMKSFASFFDALTCVRPNEKLIEDIIVGEFKGCVLQNRYLIKQRIDNGTFGEVH